MKHNNNDGTHCLIFVYFSVEVYAILALWKLEGEGLLHPVLTYSQWDCHTSTAFESHWWQKNCDKLSSFLHVWYSLSVDWVNENIKCLPCNLNCRRHMLPFQSRGVRGASSLLNWKAIEWWHVVNLLKLNPPHMLLRLFKL